MILKNATRDTMGVLYNKGGGRTEFRKTLYFKFTDPQPGDILVLDPTGDTIINQRPSPALCNNASNIGLSHVDNLTYAYTSGFYNVACQQYIIDQGSTFTLDDFDGLPGQFRSDEAILRAGQGVVILKGENSDDQVGGTVPLNPETDILLSIITINSDNQIVANPTSQTVYYDKKAGEWTVSASGMTINAAYATNPLAPSDSSIRITTMNNGGYLQFLAPSVQTSNAGKRFSFWLRHNALVNNARNFTLYKFNGNAQVSGSVGIQLTPQRGWDKTATTNNLYQLISIPLDDLGGQDPYDRFRLVNTGTGGTVDIQLDSARVESGVGTTNTDGITAIYARNDSVFYIRNGSEVFAHKSGGTNIQFGDSALISRLDTVFAIAGYGHSLMFGSPGSIGGIITYLETIAGTRGSNYGVVGSLASDAVTQFNNQTDKRKWVTIIYTGRNDIAASLATARTNILNSIQKIVDTCTAYGNDRYVIFGLEHVGGKGIGTAEYDTVNAINATMLSRWGNHFYDYNAFLSTQYNPAIGADVANHAQDVIPGSLRATGDSVHLKDLTYFKIANNLWTTKQILLHDTTGSTKALNANDIAWMLKGRFSWINAREDLRVRGRSIGFIPFADTGYTSVYGGGGGRFSRPGSTGNTTWGNNSGLNITTASGTTFVGESAGYSTTTSTNIAGFGKSALYNCLSCTFSVGLGPFAGFSATSASFMTAVGTSAGYLNNATALTAIGANSFYNNTGSANTGVGLSSFQDNTSGQQSAGVGYNVGRYNTTGSFNAYLGAIAGNANTTGSGNSMVGYQAGYGQDVTGGWSYNTFMGSYIGAAIRAGADSNTIIGARSLMDTLTGDHNIVVGPGIEMPQKTLSHFGSIGNLIYMRGGFGTAKTFGAGNVGIKDTVDIPSAALHVGTTTQGFLPPRLTSAQQDAISSPATGLVIFNTDSSKLRYYTGASWRNVDESTGGGSGVTAFTGLSDVPSSYPSHAGQYLKVNAGETGLEFGTPSAAANDYTIPVMSGIHNPGDATAYFFGATTNLPSGAGAGRSVAVVNAGTITGATITAVCATTSTNENWTLSIRLNNSTNTTINTVGTTGATKTWTATGLSIAVVSGDLLEITTTTPTWATNPTGCGYSGYLIVRQ